MCGIFCSVSTRKPLYPGPGLEQLLVNRGPDSNGKTLKATRRTCTIRASSEEVHLLCWSTVLSLRGLGTVDQPYRENDSSSTLCWNGEAWSISGNTAAGNDTRAVFSLLENSKSTGPDGLDRITFVLARTKELSAKLSEVSGPYAFVFHDQSNGLLFFGRDFLGRRSLLSRTTTDGEIVLSSVSDGQHQNFWREVSADGLYCIDLLHSFDEVPLEHRAVQTWGKFGIFRVPYNYIGDPGQPTNISVIPHLSLTEDSSGPAALLSDQSQSVISLERLLRTSLAVRLFKIPQPPTRNVETESFDSLAKIAVLFSGGLDCTVLARLAHDLLPLSEPIDLLNVAFENPRVHKTKNGEPEKNPYELCPDRITGRNSFTELSNVCPQRRWRFVAINVPFSETLEHRQNIITLMHPHNTEMDLSICCALYFAARGRGLYSPSFDDRTEPYTTSARVLLSGLGADELFGGYTRHATAYRRHGTSGLVSELDLDISRLGQRNLGRDDRVFSNWSREVRFPFLDETLVRWALNTPVHEKCDFAASRINHGEAQEQYGRGGEELEAGKKVLRCLAWRLGMKHVASEKKRAIQFGTRTAKMETGQTKGTTLLT
ncbi:asparagine synthetase domain containing protein 1 [Acrodontium crateriforme]|uniref:Asparagine synthetase domain containing protein 1 n=1 Tax=Acrodontium crateriforme TaxID=150365 RepID=A0AAQ3M2H5_9PEZI|nr:asparagine synthetase domain containing protein 1 [Acrodontium crateriforme]